MFVEIKIAKGATTVNSFLSLSNQKFGLRQYSLSLEKTLVSVTYNNMRAPDLIKNHLAFTRDCQIFVAGPDRFQNELVAAYIENHSTWKSSPISGFAALPDDGTFASCTAVLFDCSAIRGEQLPVSITAQLEQLPSDWVPALFNLDRRRQLEKNALEYGIQGCFYSDDSPATLIKGLKAIFSGEIWVSRQSMAEVIFDNGLKIRQRVTAAPTTVHDLTRREVEILGLLSSGATNDIIAAKLFISPHTVRTHLHNIFKKIAVNNRLEASIWATEFLFA